MTEPMDGTRRVVCNPVDLPYRYQDVSYGQMGRTLYREGADPSVVWYRDRYYMFVSMSQGFFHSTDLARWTYQQTDSIPALDYAPDARVVDDAIIVCASKADENCPFYRSVDPIGAGFEEVSPGTFPFWDPNLFQDDDGSVYLYWGCSNTTPIVGVQVDPATFAPRGESVDLIAADITTHGWERPGENHHLEEPKTELERRVREHIGTDPYVEGAWMTRHGDRYHLQYSAPGTEYNTYADGIYVGAGPLGPFEYSPHNPFSCKPGGFITGAGHGSTFQDTHGNWWHVATMRVSVSHAFERRVGLFPAEIDDDGVLHCDQSFADYPQPLPDRRRALRLPTAPPWMLLSYEKPASASSSAPDHGPELVADEDARTWWVAGGRQPGEWVSVDLGEDRVIHAIQVNLADDSLANLVEPARDYVYVGGVDRAIDPAHRPTGLLIEISSDGESWDVIRDTRQESADTPHLLVTLARSRPGRFVRVTAGRLPYDAPFTVSGLRVFGTHAGVAPDRASSVMAERIDPLSANVTWEASPRAHGYNVRYGVAPDKLYHCWQVNGRTSLHLSALNAGSEYWVAVDAFGETGVTFGEPVRVIGESVSS
ncbi:family 43 glycosylhydrolase [Microbacterium laevaniformans]|uniref:family 43 glycosylhydrolase n=1 Tax=Microbacterium laevaniformans TaxID=36807 RepID=UPI00363BA9F6